MTRIEIKPGETVTAAARRGREERDARLRAEGAAAERERIAAALKIRAEEQDDAADAFLPVVIVGVPASRYEILRVCANHNRLTANQIRNGTFPPKDGE